MPTFMQPKHQPRGPRRWSPGCGRTFARGSGFTLVELILVLTILAVLAGASVPTVIGLQQDKEARQPIEALSKLAKATRLRAMKEKRPYQIAFTSTGFTATRYLSPYMQAVQIDEFIQRSALEEEQKKEAGLLEENGDQAVPPGENGQTPPANGAAPTPAFREWTEKVTLPEGVTCSVKYWYESAPVMMENTAVRLWVFQPTGLVTPLTVGIHYERGNYTASFNALTADIVKETSD